MATVKLDLVAGVWQDLGAISFLAHNGGNIPLDMVAADSLPTGPVVESFLLARSDTQQFPAPAGGNWYIRSVQTDTSFNYTEV